jgi:hypothetical protein
MATFQEWNDILISYTTQNLSVGSHVFLSIDEDAIEALALSFKEDRPATGWVEDFKKTVRKMCVYGDAVNLSRFSTPLRDSKKRPRYTPFLAAMVLAAHYMGNEGDDKPIDPKDFFTHFNNLLGFSGQQGRTKGLETGVDGKMWEDWGAWLRSRGFLPTAVSGEGAYKYIGYPISQTILRMSDKNKLWRHFTVNGWKKNYDEVLLMQRVRKDAQFLTRHLRDILDPKGDMWLKSYEAISNACYTVYEDWREAGGIDTRPTASKVRTSLDAKIYREEDFFSGLVEYRLFPRQTRQLIASELFVLYNDETHALTTDRPGWYTPLWTLNSEQLSNGLKISIQSVNSPLQHLFLPARDFWVLTLDPDTPDSGIFAAWDKGIELGKPFILLVRETLQNDLIKLRNEGLLDWESVSQVFDGWYEYLGVTIQSEPQAWTGFSLENDALRLTLQPRTTFNISFIDGLRAPRGTGWIVGHGPKVTLASFLPEAEVAIYDENDNTVFSEIIEPGKIVEVLWDTPGNFRVVITQNGQVDERLVRILSWNNLDPRWVDLEKIVSNHLYPFIGAFVKD